MDTEFWGEPIRSVICIGLISELDSWQTAETRGGYGRLFGNH